MSLGQRDSPKRLVFLEFNPKILRDEKLLADEVEKILRIAPNNARAVIGKTSSTAYRRVHEIVTSALDRLAASTKQDTALLVDLSKALIMVRYQVARDQISDAIANYIDAMLRNVINATKTNWEEAKRLAISARTLLDALAVLVYEYTR